MSTGSSPFGDIRSMTANLMSSKAVADAGPNMPPGTFGASLANTSFLRRAASLPRAPFLSRASRGWRRRHAKRFPSFRRGKSSLCSKCKTFQFHDTNFDRRGDSYWASVFRSQSWPPYPYQQRDGRAGQHFPTMRTCT